MRLDNALDDIFRTRSHVQVLRTLFQLPAGWQASAREIARRAGLSHPTASKALAALSQQGLVRRQRRSNADSYALAPEHVATQQLAEIFEWERSLRDELVSLLRRQLRRRAPVVATAFLFGSAANGTMTVESDIDVALLCPGEAGEQVSTAMTEIADIVHQRFGNWLSFHLFFLAPNDRTGPERKRPVWQTILEDGIPIIPPREKRGA